MNVDERAAKSLQSWTSNAERAAVLEAFQQDPDAPTKVVSTHVDAKSAYTVRTRLARRYPNLVFKVERTPLGTGQICVSHRPAPVAGSTEQGIDAP